MSSVLPDLGHGSSSASVDCPQPSSDLLSSGFLCSLRPDTSKQVSISLCASSEDSPLIFPVQERHGLAGVSPADG